MALDIKSLTPSQKAKVRRLEKTQAEAINPIYWARNAREQEVRIEAWKSLNCSERVSELQNEYQPQIAELEAQRKALQEQIKALEEKWYELRTDIQSEPYQVVYADEQVKAMTAIIKQTKERQEEQMKALLESFNN